MDIVDFFFIGTIRQVDKVLCVASSSKLEFVGVVWYLFAKLESVLEIQIFIELFDNF